MADETAATETEDEGAAPPPPPEPPLDLEPGLYPGIPEEKYHASVGVSCSALKLFAKAPAKARYGEKETTTPQRAGALVHCALLEPAEMERRFYPTDVRFSAREKKYKDALAAAEGRDLVKVDEWDMALRVRDAAANHPVVQTLLQPGTLIEHSIYWRDPKTGLKCRGRVDAINPALALMADIKTTEDASPGKFGRSAGDYQYHWQSFYYQWGIAQACGWQPEAFWFIAIEKSTPYLIATYEVPEAWVTRAGDQMRRHLDAWAECERTGIWPGYSELVRPLLLPEWAG
jgi:exodeoxyribonuclease VIII